MTQQTPDLQIIVERLEKLEHHNRLMGVGLACLVAILSFTLFIAAAPHSKEVEATAFVLKDGSGRVRQSCS